MQFLIYMFVMLVFMVIAELTRPVPKGPNRPGLDEFQFPTADATRKVPVVWGHPVVAGLNLTWWGDFRTEKIEKKVKGMFSSKKQTIGYKHFVGMFMSFTISSGNTSLLKIIVGDDEVWKGNLSRGRGRIRQPNIWGGDESEGGIEGDFDWMPGGPEQMPNDYLQRRLPSDSGGTSIGMPPGFKLPTSLITRFPGLRQSLFATGNSQVPAYRNTARLVWRGGYVGNSKYIKEWKVQVRRLPALLGSGYHDIDGEANPAEMLYETIVDPLMGLGQSNLDVELTTFLDAARTLHDEKFGMSLVWDGAKPLSEIRADILSHIDGAMFINVMTGKWELTLNRRPTEAELDGLMTLDASNCELDGFSRPTRDETSNEVVVFWTQEGEVTKWPARAQDLGLYHLNGRQFVSTSISYTGVTSFALAARLATRDLSELSYPLSKLTLVCNREAFGLKPMSRFKWSWPALGIEGMVCRIVGIDYGTLDNNVITIEAVQDVFGLGEALYSEGGGSVWVPPVRAPQVPFAYRMEFSPYWALRMREDQDDYEAAVPILMVETPDGTPMHYELEYSDPTLGTVFAEDPESHAFTPTAVLAYDYPETQGHDTSGTLIVTGLRGMETITPAPEDEIRHLGQSLIVIDNEWMAVTSATSREDGSFMLSVQRGLGDSTIARHLAGTRVWFPSEGMGSTPSNLSPFQQGTYRARIATVSVGGKLDSTERPLLTLTSSSPTHNVRPLWPYPVRDLKVNGSHTPLVVDNQNLHVEWKTRNRATENTLFFQHDTANPVMEAGTVHRAFLYDGTGRLVASSGDILSNSYTFLAAGIVGGIPSSGYVQVEYFRNNRGAGQRATIWFGLAVDYRGLVDSAPQRLLAEAGDEGAWTFWRMAD